MKIDIAKEFSKTPFGRYRADGPFSAEAFREDLLLPMVQKQNDEPIELDFSGISLSLGSSFLEEAFGGLVREGIDKRKLISRLVILSKYPIYKQRIESFIEKA